jgi:hypothetical protein
MASHNFRRPTRPSPAGHPAPGSPAAAGGRPAARGHAALGGLALGGLGLGGLGLRGLGLGSLGLGGGGGLAHLLIRLLIWRGIWRLGLLLWRVRTFGPVIVLLIVLALVVLVILRARHGRAGRWPGPDRAGRGQPGQGKDPFGDRADDHSPRDW